MKLRVIQENNIVIVTLLSISGKILSRIKKRSLIKLSSESYNYLDIHLCSKRYTEGITVFSYGIGFGINSSGSSDAYKFSDIESADKFVRRLKNSVNIINHGTEEEVQGLALITKETLIEIIE